MTFRIAVLFEFPTVSGGEAAALDLLGRLDRDRFEPIALAPGEGPLASAIRARGLPLLPFALKGEAGNPAPEVATRSVARAAAEAGADLLHANSLATARYTGPAGVLLDVPAVGHCRDMLRLSTPRARDLAANRRLVAVSNAVATSLVSQGIPPERVEVVPDGIDFGRAASGRPGRVRPALGIGAEIPVVGSIGMIQRRKGQDVLVEAAAIVLASRPEVRFLVVGRRVSTKAESVEYEAALHHRIAALGLGNRFLFLGQRSDVPDVLADLDLFVHPANEEPQSIAVLEAMAAGLPVVATSVGGTPEIVEPGRTGLLVPPRDPRALAEAILAVLADRDLAARHGQAGRERAAQAFRPEDTAARIAAIYESLLG